MFRSKRPKDTSQAVIVIGPEPINLENLNTAKCEDSRHFIDK
jgi:hypothetical protein